MARRIYVGNLPPTADEDALRRMFWQHGQIEEVHVIADRRTGQAKGFAFVAMADDAEAERAIASLSGSDMGGRALVVSEARAREDGGRLGGAARD